MRGKEAAQAAARRLATANARVAELEHELDALRRSTSAEANELRNEVRSARADLTREVSSRSAAAVTVAEQGAREAIAGIKRASKERLLAGISFLCTNGSGISVRRPEDFSRLADLWELTPGELLTASGVGSRSARRTTGKRARSIDAFHNETDASGRPTGIGPSGEIR